MCFGCWLLSEIKSSRLEEALSDGNLNETNILKGLKISDKTREKRFDVSMT